MKGRTLAPGDGFAVPMFGEAEPAALALFHVGPPEAPVVVVAACPACGGCPCPGCGAEALSLT